jgi:hypothetical protein
LLNPFLEPLERLGLPYCVTGSVAASVYGEPRLTADIDVVLLLQVGDITALRAAFPELETEIARLGLQEQWRRCVDPVP